MNIGIFGGSFNPPHLGHLVLAQSAIEQLGLDKILFVPAFQSPFKAPIDGVTPEQRCELVALAISDNNKFELETFEVVRASVSYTADTVKHITERNPDDMLFLLMGADAFNDFHTWTKPEEIIRYAKIGVAQRPRHSIHLSKHPFGTYAMSFHMPLIDISSSAIRDRVQQGISIQYLVPWTVKTFIEAEGLYRNR